MTDDQAPTTTGETDGGVTAAFDSPADTSSLTTFPLKSQILTLAQLEYRLSLRSRWTLALTALFGLLSLLVVGFGGSSPGPVRVDAVIVSLASLATYLVPLAALVYGFDTIVGPEETGWLDMVFALPVSRSRVVVGAFLGRATSLASATAIGFGLGGIALYLRVDVVPWGLYADVLFGAVTLGLAFLAISVLVSTVAAEKTHALGVALLVWVWSVFGHDLAALGLIAAFDLPNVALTGLVLANPIDIFRVFVLSGIESTGSGMAAVVAETGLSTAMLVGSALAWVVVPVGVAARLIRRRSLSTNTTPMNNTESNPAATHELSTSQSRAAGSAKKTHRTRRSLLKAVGVGVVGGVSGCLGGGDSSDQPIPDPIDLSGGKQDDNGGMIIGEHFGPNGQIFYRDHTPDGHDNPAWFHTLSMGLFPYHFEHDRQGWKALAIYVTDYASVEYELTEEAGKTYISTHTDADTFGDATEMTYVVNSDVHGGMGKDLHPFSSADDAAAFASDHNGSTMTFDEITQEWLSSYLSRM